MQLRLRRLQVKFYCLVAYSGTYLFGEGTLVDISERGCKVHSQDKRIPREEALVTMRIGLPAPHGALKVEVAVVRWAKERDFGIAFQQLKPAEEERLQEFLKTLETPGRH